MDLAPKQTLRRACCDHWPEYLMEAAELGLFMLSACSFGVLLEHPASPVRQLLPDPFARRTLMGLAMGLTAVAIIFSPWGKQSGAHLNPAVTLAFYRLGKIEPWDAGLYTVAQFAGGIAGVRLAATFLRTTLPHPTVNYVATLPGPGGAGLAFLAELGIAFVLMSVVLRASNTPAIARFTGLFAGALVALFIICEAPLSGMSLNPARSLGSALAAGHWAGLWIYFSAPPLGMFLAALVWRRCAGAGGTRCAKLHHHNNRRCIFRCGYAMPQGTSPQTLNPTNQEKVPCC